MAKHNLDNPTKIFYGNKNLEQPGKYPYKHGIYSGMYTEKLWTMRQYAGFTSAEESNKRYRYLIDQGVMGLSVAFDLPTQTGYDSDDSISEGEVGRVGVPICSIADMDILMKGESNYLDMKDFFLALDSSHISIQGAIDILDQYFEEVAVTQFEREEAELKHRLLVEFADYYYGIPGRMKRSLKKDKDILKAISILNDPIVYKDIFLPQ